MANKTRPIETEADRLRIGEARAVLQEYGQYVDVADMSDVAYERRVVRMKAMDLTVGTFGHNSDETVAIAAKFERYIWEGADAEVSS